MKLKNSKLLRINPLVFLIMNHKFLMKKVLRKLLKEFMFMLLFLKRFNQKILMQTLFNSISILEINKELSTT